MLKSHIALILTSSIFCHLPQARIIMRMPILSINGIATKLLCYYPGKMCFLNCILTIIFCLTFCVLKRKFIGRSFRKYINIAPKSYFWLAEELHFFSFLLLFSTNYQYIKLQWVFTLNHLINVLNHEEKIAIGSPKHITMFINYVETDFFIYKHDRHGDQSDTFRIFLTI